MIRCYGIHWHSNKVFWGKQNDAGKLFGAASKSAKAKPIDFRNQRGIYALYADYDLVYIGQTGSGEDRLFNRIRSHRSDHLSDRWNRFSWFGTQWVTTKQELSVDTIRLDESVEVTLNILEAVSIAISEPRLNLQRGRWGEATKYFQWWDRQDDHEDDE